MCLAIPSRVLAIDGDAALVDTAGQQRTVNLVLLDEPVQAGDYVLIMNNQFAFERVDRERALAALTAIEEILADDVPDVRAWS